MKSKIFLDSDVEKQCLEGLKSVSWKLEEKDKVLQTEHKCKHTRKVWDVKRCKKNIGSQRYGRNRKCYFPHPCFCPFQLTRLPLQSNPQDMFACERHFNKSDLLGAKTMSLIPQSAVVSKRLRKKKRHHSVSDKLAARSSVLCLLYFSGGTQGPFCHPLQSNLNEKERKDKILHQEGFKNTFVEARWWTRLNGWSHQCFFNDELHREALRCLGQQWTVTQLRITRRRQWVHARSVDWLAHYKYEFLCCFCRERGRMHGHGERQAAICVCPFDHQFNCTSYPISEWKADW